MAGRYIASELNLFTFYPQSYIKSIAKFTDVRK